MRIIRVRLFFTVLLCSGFLLPAFAGLPEIEGMQDYFKSENFSLDVCDQNLRQSLKDFFLFCYDKNDGDSKSITEKYFSEQKNNAIALYSALIKGDDAKEFLEEFFRKINLLTKDHDDVDALRKAFCEKGMELISEVYQAAKKKKMTESGAKKRKLINENDGEFSDSTIYRLTQDQSYRHLVVGDILGKRKPVNFPGVFLDLTSNINSSFDACENKRFDVSQYSLFEFLADAKLTEDMFLIKAIYLFIKVVESGRDEIFFPLSHLKLWLSAYSVDYGFIYKDIYCDAHEYAWGYFFGHFDKEPDFCDDFNKNDIDNLNKVAKIMGIKETNSKPDFVPRSLWIIMMAYHKQIAGLVNNDEFDPECYQSWLSIMNYCNWQTAEFFKFCFAAIFYHHSSTSPEKKKYELVSKKCRQSIEYWIQLGLLEAGLSHINWREEIRGLTYPLFSPPQL